jgi:hypothetical protein
MTTMDIGAALDQIYKLQAAMEVSHPHKPGKVKVKKVFHHWPKASIVINDFPSWSNNWTAPSLEFQSALLTSEFTVNMRFYAGIDPDVDDAADIAAAFYSVIVDTFAANVKLGLSEWSIRHLRGGEPTLGIMEPEMAAKGAFIIGLDLFLDLYCVNGIVIQPGSPPS